MDLEEAIEILQEELYQQAELASILNSEIHEQFADALAIAINCMEERKNNNGT